MLVHLFTPDSYFFNPYALPRFLVGGLALLLAAIVLVREPRSPVSLSSLSVVLPVVVWLLGYGMAFSTGDAALALVWTKAVWFGVAFIPTTSLLFTVSRADRWRERWPWVAMSALGSVLFGGLAVATDWLVDGLYSYPWGYYGRSGPLIWPFLLFFVLPIAAGLRLCWQEYRRSPPGVRRLRLRATLLTFGLSSLGIVDYLPDLGVPVYPFGLVAVLAGVLVAARSIWRYRLVDITPALAAEEIIRTMADGLLVTDTQGVVRVVNRAAAEILGLSEEEMLGRPPPAPIAAALASQELVRTGVLQVHEMDYRSERGGRRVLHLSASTMHDPARGLLGVVSVVRDVTERRRMEQVISHLSYHDPLTGLPNRTLLRDRLNVALAQARRSQERVAVFVLDLDRFKTVNDALGHEGGDELLRAADRALVSLAREGDTVARGGGDEFILVLFGVSLRDVEAVAREILQTFRMPWSVGGQDFRVTASIGIALYPLDGQDAEALLRSADTAMHQAKEQGRDTYRFYDAAMRARILERLALEQELRRALERDELVLHYQPVLSVATGQVVGVEALVRWQHPERGLLFPDAFIGLAEEGGLVPYIDAWALAAACRQAQRWRRQGLPPLQVAVNVSTRSFRQGPCLEALRGLLADDWPSPGHLMLEITETAALEDPNVTIDALRSLRAMGVEVALDDFGTGYCSLTYLRRLPVDAVKIDRSFVQGLLVNPADEAFVTTIIGLAHGLGLRVVAEGVERPEQLASLRRHGCDHWQGFLFARPMPAASLERLLAETAA